MCLPGDDAVCPTAGITCKKLDGTKVCVGGATTCPSATILDGTDVPCPEKPDQPPYCLLPEDATTCPGNASLTCPNSAGASVCVFTSGSLCPDPATLDAADKLCSRPLRMCLPGDDAVCPTAVMTCEKPDGTKVCVGGATTCPNATILDGTDVPCPEKPDRPPYCLLPEDATTCPGNASLTCPNSAGTSVCVFTSDSLCPDPATLDAADKLCPRHRPRLCLLPEDATCPGTGALVCPTTDGASVCAYNVTACPPSDVLDATDFECPTMKAPLACIQDVQTSSCPTFGGLTPNVCTSSDGTAFVCVWGGQGCDADLVDSVTVLCPSASGNARRRAARKMLS
jgi:hypothetical protein